MKKSIKVEIRQIKQSDIIEIQAVNESSLPENYPKHYWVDLFQKCKPHSFVAVGDGRILGYIYCNSEIIVSFAVEEKHRNKGLGKHLMQHCLTSLGGLKSSNDIKQKLETNQESFKLDKSLKLHVRVSNPAVRFYKQFGFTGDNEASIDKKYYQNDGEDAYIMEWSYKLIPTLNYKLENKLKI